MMTINRIAIAFRYGSAAKTDITRSVEVVKHALKVGINEIIVAVQDINPENALGKFFKTLKPQELKDVKIAIAIEQEIASNRVELETTYKFAQYTFKTGIDSINIILNAADQDSLIKGLDELQKLKSTNVIKQIGIIADNVPACLQLLQNPAVTIDRMLLIAGYNLLDFSATPDLFAVCKAKNIKICVLDPFVGGLLASHEERVAVAANHSNPNMAEKSRILEDVCNSDKVELPRAAVQFLLMNPDLTGIIFTPRTELEFTKDLRRSTKRISAEFWEDLKAQKLIPADTFVRTESAVSATFLDNIKERNTAKEIVENARESKKERPVAKL